MKIVTDILATLKEDAPIEDVRACAHWIGVLLATDKGVEDRPPCGLSSTIIDHDAPHGSHKVEGVGELHTRTAGELASTLTDSENPLSVGIGIAALNALVALGGIDENHCVELNAGKWLAENGSGKKVVVVGHFPFLEDLEKVVDTLWVLEQHPAPGEHPPERAEDIIPQADVVAITGTTLINGTFDRLASLWRSDSRIMLLGPSTPLSPVLFDYGIDVVSGTVVTDAARFLTIIGHGATFQQVKRSGVVRLLTMSRG